MDAWEKETNKRLEGVERDVEILKEEQCTLTSQIVVAVNDFTDGVKQEQVTQRERIKKVEDLHIESVADQKEYREISRSHMNRMEDHHLKLTGVIIKQVDSQNEINTQLVKIATRQEVNMRDINEMRDAWKYWDRMKFMIVKVVNKKVAAFIVLFSVFLYKAQTGIAAIIDYYMGFN